MADADMDALRVHVISVFDSLVPGIHDQHAVEVIYHSILKNVISALSARLNAWNNTNAVCRLPAEVLASSFEYLSFRDKVVASHVSRSWRAAAVDFPSVWAQIDLPAVRRASSLFEMALSRAGQRLVDLSSTDARVRRFAEEVMARHLHRFRSIRWHARLSYSDTLSSPAPSLQCFSYPHPLAIEEDVFGGQPGRLRELELHDMHLPDRAPALGTVTVFSAHVPSWPEETYFQLFDIFPCLTSLTLRGLRHGMAQRFPSRPAPLSLTKLHLEAEHDADDAIQLYAAWKTENLSQVTISAPVARTNISPLVADVRHLLVDGPCEGTARLTSIDSRNHSHTLTLTHSRDASDLLIHGLRNSALEHLESLEISLAQFHSLMTPAQRPHLKSMKNLKLRHYENISTSLFAHPGHRFFHWDRLDALLHLHKLHLELQSFILEVRCIDSAQFPTPNDALELLKRLPYAVEAGMSSVCIRGFPSAAVRNIDLNSVPGLKIEFEAM